MGEWNLRPLKYGIIGGIEKNLFEMGSKQEVRGLMVLHQLFLLFFIIHMPQ